MVWIGNDRPGDHNYELHHSRYDFNDEILPVAARWLAEVARLALRQRYRLTDAKDSKATLEEQNR